jgi:hypothetical protein
VARDRHPLTDIDRPEDQHHDSGGEIRQAALEGKTDRRTCEPPFDLIVNIFDFPIVFLG